MEKLNTQKSEKVQDNNDLNYKELRTEVEGTPFIIYEEKEMYYVLLGKYMIGKFKEKEEAIEDARRFDLERVMQIIALMITNEKQ